MASNQGIGKSSLPWSNNEEEQIDRKRCQFGSRLLTDDKNVFEHNAWDNVQWDDEQEQLASEKVKLNSEQHMEPEKIDELEINADEYWDKFYGIHQNRFFKDRHWLFTEFPELYTDYVSETLQQMDVSSLNKDFPGSHATKRFLEVGCGVGNTVFPILAANKDPQLFVYCCDFSETAVSLVKENEEYEPKRCHGFVCDISDMDADMPFPDNSLDIITMIFVLSAIKPDKMQDTLNRLARLLKPGGQLLFRDYGRYDLAQLRFKKGKCLGDNFYARGDGTMVYFFTQEEIGDMLTKAGLEKQCNLVDRRLQVNRGRQLKMYRVWIQYYLFAIAVTSTDQMVDRASDEQHDNFGRQLSAFEKLLVHSYAKFSLDDLHGQLKLVLRDGAKNKGMLKITSLTDLQECIEMCKQTVKDEQSVQDVTTYFEGFFEQLSQLERLRQNFNDNIYSCLYTFYYDLLDDVSDDEGQHDSEEQQDEEDSGAENDAGESLNPPAGDSDPSSSTPEPLKPDTPAPSMPPPAPKEIQQDEEMKPHKNKHKSKHKSKSKDTTDSENPKKKKKKKRKDNRLKVLERIKKEKEREALLAKQNFEVPHVGKELEQLNGMSDRQKLSHASRLVHDIEGKWYQLNTVELLNADLFDEDSQYELKAYKNYLSFESLFRLIPDIFVKGFKLIELAKVWYNSARRLYGPKPAVPHTMDHHFYRILDLEQSIEQQEEDMRFKAEQKVTKIRELEMLNNQIDRYVDIDEKYTECGQNEHELTIYYQELKAERDKAVEKLEKMDRSQPKYRKLYNQTQKLENQLVEVYNQLKAANYELEIMKQDYSVELEAKPDLIRSHSDVKACINDIDESMPRDCQQRIRSIKDCILMKSNGRRMWAWHKQNNIGTELEGLAERALQDVDYSLEINTEETNETKSSDHSTSVAGSDNRPDSDMEGHQREPATGSGKTFNPSTAGIIDAHEAKDYRERVERLKKDFTLDLSHLPKDVNCEVSPREVPPDEPSERPSSVNSGDEADMDSDRELNDSPSSTKRYTKKYSDRSHYSPLSDASDEYKYSPEPDFEQESPSPASSPIQTTPKTIYVLRKSSPKPQSQTLYILKRSPNDKKRPSYAQPPGIAHQRNDIVYKQRGKADGIDRHKRQNLADQRPRSEDINEQFIDTLSLYKKASPLSHKVRFHTFPGDNFSPREPQTLDKQSKSLNMNMNMSDGDISSDSGTGTSLTGDSEDERKKAIWDKLTKRPAATEQKASEYKHKPRREAPQEKKTVKSTIPARLPNTNDRPSLMSNVVKSTDTPRLPDPSRHQRTKPKPQSVRHIDDSPRLQQKLPARTKHPTLEQTKCASPPKRTAGQPAYKVPAGRQAISQSKGNPAKRYPVIIPKGRGNKKPARYIESPSDSGDEVFQQKSVAAPMPPRPSVRTQLMQAKHNKRKERAQKSVYAYR